MEKDKKPNAYQAYRVAANEHCRKGTETSARKLERARTKYETSALEKGKTKTEIREIRARVEKCPAVSGTRKKTKKK